MSIALAIAFIALQTIAMPDESLTPGAVTSTNAAQVCRRGFAQSIRHPYDTQWRRFRVAVFHRYGISHDRWPAYTLDHLIPLELGGAPFDLRNVWPQPKVEAKRKDKVEERLRFLVCDRHTLTLWAAQASIARDWTHAP